jgi:hypothetical protein
MNRFLPIVVVLLLFALFAGCTGVPPVQNNTTSGDKVTFGTVDTLPSESNVVIQVNPKDPISNKIDVSFAGGEGQIQVKSIEVLYTGNDGVTQTQILKPEKGATVTFQGTNQTDRVEAYVTLYTGNRYKVVNQTSPYRTRA